MARKTTEEVIESRYESKDGFEEVKLRRGFDDIAELWKQLKHVEKLVSKKCYILGGYARYCASPREKPVKAADIDVYSQDQKMFDALETYFKARRYKVKHENNMAITFKKKKKDKYPIQLIKPLKVARLIAEGTVEEILGNFDFTIIRAAIISPTKVLVDADFLHDEEGRLIRMKNIHCPVSSNLRCMKYSRKGYFLTPFECLKLFIDWEQRPPDYRVKLMDFLEKAKGRDGLTQEEVDELEEMMRID